MIKLPFVLSLPDLCEKVMHCVGEIYCSFFCLSGNIYSGKCVGRSLHE